MLLAVLKQLNKNIALANKIVRNGTKIKMYGAEWCPDCRRTKEFFTKNNIDFEYINIDITPEA
jgi:thiol-disulfide isomerase/thioredoxin